MRTKKFKLSLALAGLLVAAGVTSAAAEESGAFVGAQVGYSANKFTMDMSANWGSLSASETASGVRYGFLAGYKQFFTPSFGARYYGVVDFGNYSKTLSVNGEEMKFKNKSWGISANADALYNFVSSESLDFGLFAGLSLGYASNDFGDNAGVKPSGFDLGVNFGLRTNIAQHHSIELYSRFGVLKQKDDIVIDPTENSKQDWQSQYPYAVGLRYVFSF